MQAILTRVIPATNTKPTRIKASCERGSVTLDTGGFAVVSDRDSTHRQAAYQLINKFTQEDFEDRGEPVADNPWSRPFVTGQLTNGDFCHVFL